MYKILNKTIFRAYIQVTLIRTLQNLQTNALYSAQIQWLVPACNRLSLLNIFSTNLQPLTSSNLFCYILHLCLNRSMRKIFIIKIILGLEQSDPKMFSIHLTFKSHCTAFLRSFPDTCAMYCSNLWSILRAVLTKRITYSLSRNLVTSEDSSEQTPWHPHGRTHATNKPALMISW